MYPSDGAAVCVGAVNGAGGTRENAVPSPQCHWEPTTARKHRVYELKEKENYRERCVDNQVHLRINTEMTFFKGENETKKAGKNGKNET